MKKRIWPVAAAMAGVLAFTACAGQTAAPAPEPATDVLGQEAPAAPPTETADGRMFEETFHIRWLEEGRPHMYDDNNMVSKLLTSC